MRFNTMESQFEYNVKHIMKQFIKDTGTTATGEELDEVLWNERQLIGELFLTHLDNYLDIAELVDEIRKEND